MIRRPPRSTRTDTLLPYTTLFRADYGWRSKQYAAPMQLPAAARVGLTPEQIAAGNQALQDTSKISSYGILNARIAFELAEPDLEFAVYATNITKEKYFTRLLSLENTPFGLTSYTPGDRSEEHTSELQSLMRI